jgi:excisionase family DNA binding protein
MAEDGKLPARKVGDEWRFTRSALLRWLGGEEEE